jgi:hypothetical protein
MNRSATNSEAAATLALAALSWTLQEEARAGRLLALTGLSVEDLRARVAEAEVLAAVLAFLEGHEPDLIACAADLGIAPAELVEARRNLEA